ncbi:MAG TPA: hypothetical protein VD701_09930, partial [Steroidobacteraceae bacterium]|nr:hypothetical protein [Steroidobacteraceae bacterium]
MRHWLAGFLLLPVLASAQEGMRIQPEVQRLNAMTARYAPVDIRNDLRAMPDNERRALASLIHAARVVDALYLRQAWAGNEALLLRLLEDETLLGRARLDYFLLNKGPWSELDENKPFIPAVPGRPGGANYYPADATKEQVEAWIAGLPAAAKAEATGYFTTIRRDGKGRFAAVPYSLEYQGELAEMARHLRAAAAATRQPTLKAFLESRADAFFSNDYYASDVAWMKLDSTIEPTIGPYE